MEGSNGSQAAQPPVEIQIKWDPRTGGVMFHCSIDNPVVSLGILEFAKALLTKKIANPEQGMIAVPNLQIRQ